MELRTKTYRTNQNRPRVHFLKKYFVRINQGAGDHDQLINPDERLSSGAEGK